MTPEALQEIAVEFSRSCIEIIEKPWESKLLSRKVIALNWKSQCDSIPEHRQEETWTQILQKFQLKLKKFKLCLLTARISTLNTGASRALENCGFHLMECYLELEHNLKHIPQPTGKNTIRHFYDNDIPQLEKIAMESFQYSRFHMDPEINQNNANTTRAQWVKNSCVGRAETVLVAEIYNHPVGFVTCQKGNSKGGTIGKLDLIAVHPDYRNRKIGYDLTVEFLRFCHDKKYKSATVGTQAHNIPSICLYEKTGFFTSQSYYSYHNHIKLDANGS